MPTSYVQISSFANILLILCLQIVFLATPADITRNAKEMQEDCSESLENVCEFASCKNMLHRVVHISVVKLNCMFIAGFTECFS